jgi:hypothetical protein
MIWRYLKLLSGSTGNGSSDLARPQGSDLVGERGRGQRTLRGRVDRATEVNILNNSIASHLGVSEKDGAFGGIGKGGALDQHLGSHSGVHAREDDAIPVIVDEMDGGKTNERLSAVDILPIVVGIGDVEFARVLGSVVIGVAD